MVQARTIYITAREAHNSTFKDNKEIINTKTILQYTQRPK
jgi:hypothetical protein